MYLERRQSPCYAQGVCPLVVSPRDRRGPYARGYRQRQPPVSGGGLAIAGKTWELLCTLSTFAIHPAPTLRIPGKNTLLTALSSAKPSRMTQYRKLGEGDAVIDRVRDRKVTKTPDFQAYNTSHHERWGIVFETQETPKNSKITIIVVIVAVMLLLIAATWFLTS